jgi:cobalt-zinc-cadmium efflux system outer membrane protein
MLAQSDLPVEAMRPILSAVFCSIVAIFPVAAPVRAAEAPSADTARQGISLDAAIDAGENANIDLLTARLAVKTAQANLRSADTAPNPVFSTNTVQVRPSQIGKLPYGQLVDTVVRIDVPLERGGKRRARTGAARASIDAAQGDLGDARRQMRAAVIGAYFDLKAAEAKVAALRAIADGYADGQRIATKQQRAGALSNGDLARQKVEVLKAETDARQAVSDWRDGQLALATLIGREADAPSLATITDWPQPAGISGEPADSLALRRPDVLAAQARVEAARRNLDGAHALKYSDITVGAQYERAGGDLGVGNSVGVGVSIPLPVRNLYHGEVDAAGVALVQAEAQARKAAALATADIVIARRSLAEATERRKIFDESQLPAARKAADVAEFAYSHGAMTLLELLDARRSLQAVELGAIGAHSDEAHAIARLRAAETTGDN